MKHSVLFALALAVTAPAFLPIAEAASASASAKRTPWSVETAKIGQLLDNPAAKAIFLKHLPVVVNGKGLWVARGMTLREIMRHTNGYITDEKLAAMDADLKDLPPRVVK
jgi:hypothetical protein